MMTLLELKTAVDAAAQDCEAHGEALGKVEVLVAGGLYVGGRISTDREVTGAKLDRPQKPFDGGGTIFQIEMI